MRGRRILLLAVLATAVPTGATAEPTCGTSTTGLPQPVSGPCPGIRPGARMTGPAGCTMNFVFRGSTANDLYIGTAAHCVGYPGQAVSLAGEGVIGFVAYTGFSEINDEVDFALVKISPSKLDRVDPAVCHWGGPTGVFVPTTWPTVVAAHHYGHGVVTGTLVPTRARTALIKGWGDKRISFLGAVAWGDSGSPLITQTGLAAGAIVSINYNGDSATRIDVGMDRASARLGVPLSLVTAPLA